MDDVAKKLCFSKRILIIAGKSARKGNEALIKFIDRFNALYLDTGESRGVVPTGHAANVSAVRGKVMEDADIIFTIGRKLDFQLAYGSPAIFRNAKFIRISDSPFETMDNRKEFSN